MVDQIYGVDLGSEVTPRMVRDALVECFYQAHCLDTGLEKDDEGSSREYCQEITRKAFVDTGADFDQPDKASLIKVMDNLAEFSKNFRSQDVIKEHYQKIRQLLDSLSD